MKILHINSARKIGGGEKHLIDLVSGLVARGHEMHVAVRPNSSLHASFGGRPDVKLVPLALLNALDLPSALQLARYLRRHRIELLHAHLARDYPVAALAAHLSNNTSFVVTRHLLFPLKPLHRWTLRSAKKVICVSQGVAQAMRRSKVVAEDKIVVVLNGIELSKFNDVRVRCDSAALRRRLNLSVPLIVGTIGELSPHKGHEDFLRAAAIIVAHRDDVAFVIAGEDASPAQKYRAQLEHFIHEAALEERVRLLGWLPDVAPLYGALDLFVSAARSEPFGLVIVEAMASGAPAIVATMTDGAREIIEDGVTGILVPISDTERLATTIQRLLDDAEFRNMLTARARHAAQMSFSLDRMVSAVEAIYKEVRLKGV